jgi:hypothetical protein
MTFTFRWLVGAFLAGILACLAVHWMIRPAPPAPLTPGQVADLGDAGFDPADEGPLEDATPALPGRPAGTVTVEMRRRAPRDSGPGAIVPGDLPQSGAVLPAPIPPGLTSDDLSGAAIVTLRQAGGDLWTRADLTCCAGEVCRVEEGAETAARWDRAALCGQVRRGRLLTLGLGVAIPSPEIVASGAFYREGHRMGYYGAVRYQLDPATTETVQSSGEFGYRTVSDTAAKLRVEAGLTWRFGR